MRQNVILGVLGVELDCKWAVLADFDCHLVVRAGPDWVLNTTLVELHQD